MTRLTQLLTRMEEAKKTVEADFEYVCSFDMLSSFEKMNYEMDTVN